MGYERSVWRTLHFLHNRRQTPNTPNRRSQSLPAALTSSRLPLVRDKIDRTARPRVVEDPDHQPSGPPGERIQVGAAFIQQRTFRKIVMAVNDVKLAVPERKPLRIALPHQCRFALLAQGNLGIDTGVNIDPM